MNRRAPRVPAAALLVLAASLFTVAPKPAHAQPARTAMTFQAKYQVSFALVQGKLASRSGTGTASAIGKSSLSARDTFVNLFGDQCTAVEGQGSLSATHKGSLSFFYTLLVCGSSQRAGSFLAYKGTGKFKGAYGTGQFAEQAGSPYNIDLLQGTLTLP